MIDRLSRNIRISVGDLGRMIRVRFMGANIPIVGAPPRTLVPHVAFALALIVPILLVCALIAKQWVASEQDRFDGRIAELAANVTEDLDRVRALRALATSPALDHGDSRLFNRYIEDALRAATAPDRYAVLVCDLDRFKIINDTFGHLAGDRLLCAVAERIRAALRHADGVARLGGDEFAVVVSDINGEAAVRRVCERIIAAVDEPLTLDDLPIDLGISIGVAMISDDGLTAEEVFQRADTALYDAKAAGRSTYRLYEARTQTRVTTRNVIALDMKEAIRRGDFYFVYQPVIDITTGAVASFEALMRWQHPDHGTVSPGDFIPVAEETGLIVALGTRALGEACREATMWPASVRVAVNVSPVQFREGLDQTVIMALAQSGLPADRLKREVTESLLIRDSEKAVASLHRLRGLGVKIALDDFSTGYSSLSYLRRFPFDRLKIDRTFVRDIADPDAAEIVRAVVQIGERLGMGIVAEGVETQEQLELVRREGCTEVQGFLFSKPLPAAQARAFAGEHDIGAAA
jgi:diguanylate cyclase (GGDEF)-like protein